MCDTPTEYKHGDVAWVKLGACWWPGEVTDFEQLEESLKEDLKSSSRGRLPLAIVKFFQEDSYEYVKKSDQIYPYDCSKKDEFIRKGLDMHRAKKSNMEKFPEDVVTAEKKTNGDENIINDEKYTLPKKKDVIKISEIFGTPKLKASPKPPGRSKGSAIASSGNRAQARFVTHPRFIGKRNDHQRVVLVQQKKEEAKVALAIFKCSICGFASNRVNSVALHSKTHIKTDPLFNDVRKKAKKRGPKKRSVAPPHDDRPRSPEKREAAVSAGEASDVEVPEKKKRRKRKRAPPPTAPEDAGAAKKPAPDITNDLLAEWDDGDDDDRSADGDADANANAQAAPKPAKAGKPKSPAKVARHAPKEHENGAKTTADKLEIDFSALMESTKVPEMPTPAKADAPKVGAKSPEIATKLTNPKKRFVKSFEDFELSMKEKQQELCEKERDLDVSVVEERGEVKGSPEAVTEAEEKKQAVSPTEDKKHTRRSTRFVAEKETAPEKVDEKEGERDSQEEDEKKVPQVAGKKATRRSALRAEKVDKDDKEEEKKKDEMKSDEVMDESERDEKKPNRRISIRADGEKSIEQDVKKDDVADDKKSARRGSTKEKVDKPDKAEKIDEKDNEPRKSARRSEIKPKEDDRKPDAEYETGSESEKRDKSPKKARDDAKQSKDAKVDADKGRKDLKAARIDENAPKKEDKPEEKASLARKDADKAEGKDKSDKKLKPHEKAKPKEKLLFEIDVFGSLRAQENEKYNKRADDSPRRETRASRSKSSSHGDGGSERREKDKVKEKEATKIAPKRAKKDDEDAQVNNGKSDEPGSPLISKMKNKLMNKLTTDVVEAAPRAKTRQRTQSRALSADDADAKVEEQEQQKPGAKRGGVSRQRAHSSNDEADDLSDADSDDEVRTPETPQPAPPASPRSTPSTAKSDVLLIDESTPDAEEKHAAGDASAESAAVKVDVKSPSPKSSAGRSPKTYLRCARPDKAEEASPTRPETIGEEAGATADIVTPVASPIKEDVKLTGEALLDELSRLHAPADDRVDDWLKVLSPSKKKVGHGEPEEARTSRDASPAPTSPVKAPPSPSSPLRQSSPLKSPPIILNKDASKFDPASTPKKIARRDEEAPKPTAKSPRRISLTSQEVSITDKVEVSAGDNGGVVVAEERPVEQMAEQPEAAVEASADPLDMLASVSTLNKDVIEKNVTVVPENILADGQVEIAKIIEGGTEKVASIPKVAVAEKEKLAERSDDAQGKESAAATQDEVESSVSQKPIILNSRLATVDQESTTKLLDILSDKRVPTPAAKTQTQQVPLPKIANPKFDVETKKPAGGKPAGRIVAGAPAASTSRSKPTILSDTIVRPADTVVSVQKVKRTYDDIEDIDAFIITKHPKKAPADEEGKKPAAPTAAAAKSKPKILEHTIITAAGQVLQPISKVKKQPIVQQQTIKVPTGSTKTVEEKVYDLLNSPKGKEDDAFDIDNMPIVLGDALLAEHVEPDGAKSAATQVVVRKPTAPQIKPIPKPVAATASAMKTTPASKTYTKVVKTGQRIYQPAVATTSPAVVKHQPTILASGKQGKFVIVPSQNATASGSKYTVGKRPLAKKQPAILQSKAVAAESGGSKIMIVTNNQGHQQRVLITPENQRLLGYQGQVKKTIVKAAPPAPIKERAKVVAHAQASPGPGLMAVKKPKIDAKPAMTQQQQQQKVAPKFSLQGAFPPMKGSPGQTRTVIIKNQQGEVVNRIHGTSDEEIEKKVAEQLEAINRAASKSKAGAMPVKRVIKKAAAPVSDATRTALHQKAANAAGAPAQRNAVPPLAPITTTAKKAEPPKQVARQQKAAVAPAKVEAPKLVEKKEERPPKQLVIQDAMGNETTIMEGQILALPSETVDGQPQSYMLVTLDESGSLTPLNNEALMSLDPNLNLGGDWSNMVLQIEGSGAGAETTTDSTTTTQATKTKATPQRQPDIQKQVVAPTPHDDVQQQALQPRAPPDHQVADVADVGADAEAPTEQIHAITCSINKGDTQQNLIITGDPVATQKFLESLTEGNPEIANLLAHVDGQNILIHTDGQQILINSDVDNSMLMSLNSQLGAEAADDASQLFAAQSTAKNQDILAAALADTDVFQQEQQQTVVAAAGKLSQQQQPQAQLSPGYALAVNNVLETSTVNSPIMTPLEVPSASAKIKECDVLTRQVPKNVDLPITITDPHIAQSVSNQQAASLLQAELVAGIELPLTIADAPATSAEMSSPSFYALPALVDDAEKFAGPMSMPLLTEDDPEENNRAATSAAAACSASDGDAKPHDGTAEYLLATGDMCTMTSQMSSLSEPPPDMFDFPVEQTSAFCNSAAQMTPPAGERALEASHHKRALPDATLDDDDDDDGGEEKRAKLD